MPIISAIIGSTLIGTVLTALANEFNKPNIYLSLRAEPEDSPVVYTLTAQNNGRTAAHNFRLSVFLPGNITSYLPLYGEDLSFSVPRQNIINNPLLNKAEPSLLIVNTSRFASNALIAIDIFTTPTSSNDSRYVSATYDEGSRDLYFRGNRIGSDIHLPEAEVRRPLISYDSLILLAISLMSAIFFSVAVKQTKDKRNLARSVLGIEEEIRLVGQKLESSKGSLEELSVKFWVNDSLKHKHQVIRSNKDYEAIERFYNTLTSRNLAIATADDSVIGLRNEECLKKATSALRTVDWSRYYGYLGFGSSIDLLLAFLVSIPPAVLMFIIFEQIPLEILVPEVFIQPDDVVMTPAPLYAIDEDPIGRVWLHALVIEYALILIFISFMVRGFVSFAISKEIIRRIYSGANDDRGSSNNIPIAVISPSRQQNSLSLMSLSFLIMGFPIGITLIMFFNESILNILRNQFGGILLFVVVGFEILRFSVLTVLVPELHRRGKIRVETKDNGTVKERSIMHLLGGSMILAGIFHIIVLETIVQLWEADPLRLRDIPLFDLIIIVGFCLFGLGLIILGMYVQRRKFTFYSTIAMSTVVVIFWFFGFLQYSSDFAYAGENESRREYAHEYYIFATGIMIVTLMFISLGINILFLRRYVLLTKKDSRINLKGNSKHSPRPINPN